MLSEWFLGVNNSENVYTNNKIYVLKKTDKMLIIMSVKDYINKVVITPQNKRS